MVRIRLRRTGARNQAHYRVVVTNSRSPRDGRFIEIIGHYNPRTEPSTAVIDEGRALYWLSVGAQPSEAVERMLRNQGTMDRLTRLKAGEDLEDLVAEVGDLPEVDPRTRRSVIESAKPSAVAKAPAPTAVAEEVEEEVEEVVADAEEDSEEAEAEEAAAVEEAEEEPAEEAEEEPEEPEEDSEESEDEEEPEGEEEPEEAEEDSEEPEEDSEEPEDEE